MIFIIVMDFGMKFGSVSPHVGTSWFGQVCYQYSHSTFCKTAYTEFLDYKKASS